MNISGLILQTWKIFKKNIRDKYLGSKIGIVWAFLQPLLLMSIYVVVFGFVMKLKVSGSDSSLDYVSWFLCGFTPWMVINSGIFATANSVITGNVIIKNFAIRSETLPLAASFDGAIQGMIGILVSVLLTVISGRGISWHLFLLAPVVIVTLLLVIGIGLWLAPLCVFRRDVIQLLPTVLQVVFYITPIFFDVSSYPVIAQKLTFLNPFYQVCRMYRDIIFYHTMIDLYGTLYVLVLEVLLIMVGWRFYGKLKGLFESML